MSDPVQVSTLFEYRYREYFPHIFLDHGRYGSRGQYNVKLQPTDRQYSFAEILQNPKSETPAARAKRRRKERFQARLGIAVNNLAITNAADQIALEFGGNHKVTRAKNYQIQRAISYHNLADESIHTCGRIGVGLMVGVKINRAHGSASLQGVHTCKSVWGCPVCRKKIQNARAETLSRIYTAHKRAKGRVYMITLTVPHTRGDNLVRLYGNSDNKTGISGAMTRLRQSRAFRELKKRCDYLADIRAVEVTHGQRNGYHPHIHMQVYCSGKMARSDELKLLKVWKSCVLKSGLAEPSGAGVDIKEIKAKSGAEYIAKWAAAGEMSSDQKKAKSGNYSMFELENMLIDAEYRRSAGMKLLTVCRILSVYYKSMKGQKMLVKSGENLEDLYLGENEKSDAEIIDDLEKEKENYSAICALRNSDFKKIVMAGGVNSFINSVEIIYDKHKDKTDWKMLLFGEISLYLKRVYKVNVMSVNNECNKGIEPDKKCGGALQRKNYSCA